MSQRSEFKGSGKSGLRFLGVSRGHEAACELPPADWP